MPKYLYYLKINNLINLQRLFNLQYLIKCHIARLFAHLKIKHLKIKLRKLFARKAKIKKINLQRKIILENKLKLELKIKLEFMSEHKKEEIFFHPYNPTITFFWQHNRKVHKPNATPPHNDPRCLTSTETSPKINLKY